MKSRDKSSEHSSTGIAIGIIAGVLVSVIFWLFTDNASYIGIFLPLGVVFGIAIPSLFRK